jgi:hypothetical protein
VLTCQWQICTGFLVFNIWSTYENIAYFITYFKFDYKFAVHSVFGANSKYADGLQMNMPWGYIGACVP